MTFSIIQKSQLEGADRIDAEYYQPEYLRLQQKLSSLKSESLDKLTKKIDVGFVSSMTDHFRDSGIPLLRTQNIKEFVINTDGYLVYVDEDFHKKLKKSQVKPGQVLIARSGSIGEASIVPQGFPMSNSADIILVETKDNLLPEFLTAFVNSEYGKFQIERGTSGGLQGHMNLFSLEKLIVPIFDLDKQVDIKEVVNNIFLTSEESKSYYSQAESLLLEELGLKDFKIPEDLSYIVNYSDTEKVDRVDADYYQPKYRELLEKINFKNPQPLSDFVKSYSTGYTFKSENYQESGIPLIRINNIKKGSLDLSDTAYLTQEDHLLSPKDIAKTGDVVLSMSGTVGATALVPVDIPVCSVNQRIFKFTPQNIDSEYLVLLLNSIVGNYQLERIGTGGVQTNISYKDIQNILIPVLPTETQQKIADLVIKSHEARKKSKEFLEEAKRKVEEMVEKAD